MTELLQKVLDAVKGLTIVNVVVIGLLAIILVPLYVGWRMLNDPNLMGAVFNIYSEIETTSECPLAYEQPAGGQGRYVIRAVLAERNAETWYISTKVKFQPDDQAMTLYCAALTALVDYIRDPNNEPVPVYPGSERRIVPVAPPKHPTEKDDGRPVSSSIEIRRPS
jgi:hypothetical protein